MPQLFDDFDFRLLDDPEFREDAVREELVAPLLRALGYTVSPPYRIIRSRKLDHPFVHFGTVRKGITIIPDYLLERDGEYAWILDAKAPGENINTGKNVEQAYSYAMHRDIRVPLYGLCNGRNLVVYHVSEAEPVIDVALQDIESVWPMILGILGCRSAWPNGLQPGFFPDMGLALLKAGLAHDNAGKNVFLMFASVLVTMVAKVEDGLYSLNGIYDPQGTSFIATFDFGPEEYKAFLAVLEDDLRENVASMLSRQPYRVFFDNGRQPWLTIMGELGNTTFTNENESYRPFRAEAFLKDAAPEEFVEPESAS
ncbi:MAG TPA: hypothetical protein VGG97_15025 [Bryobacteraceae bacterium]